MWPASWVALAISSGVASSLPGFFLFLGKRMSLLLYSFNLWTFTWRLSRDLFLRLLSTAMPMVLAKRGCRPTALNSSLVNPLPSLVHMLCLVEGHLTTGYRRLMGRGAILPALTILFCFLLFFFIGPSKWVLTNLCQSLWKWVLGII